MSDVVPDRDKATRTLVYEPNPKHKPIPTPGRHGSICPRNADGQGLLATSVLFGLKRYATDGTTAFCAQEHAEDRWHGYPIAWEEVPPKVVAGWVAETIIDRRTIRRSRKGSRKGRD